MAIGAVRNCALLLLSAARQAYELIGCNSHVPWLRKFLAHGDGIAIVRAYTSSAWFHQWAVKAQTMCFPRGKTKFIRPDGSIGRAPGHGVVLLGMGAIANKALEQCGLGFFVPIDEGVLTF